MRARRDSLTRGEFAFGDRYRETEPYAGGKIARYYLAVTDEELERGLIAFAAPVFRYDGTVVAALSVSAPTTRRPPSRRCQGRGSFA